MSVRIRLQRKGRKKQPFYRLVAADRQAPRDGRFIELLGTYDPMVEPPAITFKHERIQHWLEQGATSSDTVRHLIKRSLEASEGEGDARVKPSTRRRAKEKEAARAEAAKEAKAAKAEAAKAEAAEAKAEEKAADEAPAEEAAAEETPATEE